MEVVRIGNIYGENKGTGFAGNVWDKENLCPTITTEQRLEPNSQGICNTLTSVQKDNLVMETNKSQYRIRKLTPLECWRLMDFSDEDFNKAAEVNSNTQLYKQAGNSIVRNVLVAILGQMIPGKEDVYRK